MEQTCSLILQNENQGHAMEGPRCWCCVVCLCVWESSNVLIIVSCRKRECELLAERMLALASSIQQGAILCCHKDRSINSFSLLPLPVVEESGAAQSWPARGTGRLLQLLASAPAPDYSGHWTSGEISLKYPSVLNSMAWRLAVLMKTMAALCSDGPPAADMELLTSCISLSCCQSNNWLWLF